MADRPFMTFLICSERSGSNLITKMADSHPQVCGPSPAHIIRTFSQNLLRYGNLDRDENWNSLLTDVVDVLNNQLGKWKSSWEVEQINRNISERSLAAVIHFIFEAEARLNDKYHVFIKENKIYNYIAYILAAFPESRFVYLVRDPRDMALSWKRSANHPGSVLRGANIWKEDQSKCMVLYGYLLETNKILLLRYEDLIENPEKQMARLCTFMQLPYSPNMIKFHEQDLTVTNANLIKDWENLGKPVLNTNKLKYKSALSELEIRYIEAICETEMNFFGYHLDFNRGNVDELTREMQNFEKDCTLIPHQLSTSEKNVRKNRLAIIQRIVNRQIVPFCPSQL